MTQWNHIEAVVNNGSVNTLLTIGHEVIIWTNTDLLSITPKDKIWVQYDLFCANTPEAPIMESHLINNLFYNKRLFIYWSFDHCESNTNHMCCVNVTQWFFS